MNTAVAQDIKIRCIECRKTFTFTGSQQKFFSERSLQDPVRCDHCRHRVQNNAERFQGEVFSYDPNTSWGFIRPDKGGEDLFAHAAHIRRERNGHRVKLHFKVGQKVEYAKVETEKGFKAVDVVILDQGSR